MDKIFDDIRIETHDIQSGFKHSGATITIDQPGVLSETINYCQKLCSFSQKKLTIPPKKSKFSIDMKHEKGSLKFFIDHIDSDRQLTGLLGFPIANSYSKVWVSTV